MLTGGLIRARGSEAALSSAFLYIAQAASSPQPLVLAMLLTARLNSVAKPRPHQGRAIQIELKGVPAYSEGCGLYSENLIKDTGDFLKIGELRNKAQKALCNKLTYMASTIRC